MFSAEPMSAMMIASFLSSSSTSSSPIICFKRSTPSVSE
jgi:hypothetical protein